MGRQYTYPAVFFVVIQRKFSGSLSSVAGERLATEAARELDTTIAAFSAFSSGRPRHAHGSCRKHYTVGLLVVAEGKVASEKRVSDEPTVMEMPQSPPQKCFSIMLNNISGQQFSDRGNAASIVPRATCPAGLFSGRSHAHKPVFSQNKAALIDVALTKGTILWPDDAPHRR